MKMRTFLTAAALFATSVSPSWACDQIYVHVVGSYNDVKVICTPKSMYQASTGENWVQVASRATEYEAVWLAQSFRQSWPYTQVFRSKNGWYAVVIGSIRAHRSDLLEEWRYYGEIPHDSYMTQGKSFVERIVF